MTEMGEDVSRHAGVVTLSTPSILREFDLSESESAASKLDTSSLAAAATRFATCVNLSTLVMFPPMVMFCRLFVCSLDYSKKL